jgi:hypothetical protein
MTARDIERFFTALARSWPHRTDCILVGGAAAILEGGLRPTADVDFEVRFGGAISVDDPDIFAGAIRDAEIESGLSGQFTESLASWSPIALPPYRRGIRRWKSFGPITVRLLDPADYVLTKLRRGAAHDFADLLVVARRNHVSWRTLALRCAAAARLSPWSTSLRTFAKRVEYLFREHGLALWGARFDPAVAVALFRKNSARRGRSP